MSSRRRRVRGLVALSALLLGTSMLSACDNGDDILNGGSADDTTGASGDPSNGSDSESADAEDPDAASVSTNIKRKTDVPVSTQLLVFAHNGRLSTVSVERLRRRRRADRRDRRRRRQVEGRRPARARHDVHREGERGR